MTKALLVTGCSRGIGRACALLAARQGWSVGVNYRADAGAADAVVHAVETEGGRAIALRGDVSSEADVVAMFGRATNALGLLTGVVANAGVVAPTARLAEMSAERMRSVFEVTVLGAYLTTREAARRMSKSAGGAGGSIVLISSAAARPGSARPTSMWTTPARKPLSTRWRSVFHASWARRRSGSTPSVLASSRRRSTRAGRTRTRAHAWPLRSARPAGHDGGSRGGRGLAPQRRSLLRCRCNS